MKRDNLFIRTGMGIEIPLNYKGFIVRANILRQDQTNTYGITFEIGHISFDYWAVIKGDEFILQSEKSINYETYRFTMDKFAAGYFKPFLDRYELEQTAMARGIEIMEAERMAANV